MKKLLYMAILLAALMFAEYRMIMHSIVPTIGTRGAEGCVVYLDVFGAVDAYYAEYAND